MSVLGLVHFIRPGWLLLLPLVVLLPWAWRRSRRAAGDWSRVCDPHLLRWLSVDQGAAEARGGGRWLAALALLLVIVALAGPSWQKLPDVSYSARDARVVVLDLSRSMLAEDLRPNRLTRARFRLADLLARTEEGQVGLVSFAGDAYVVSPLTSDMNTIANLLPALQPDIVPVAGSRADLALELAADLLARSGQPGGQILLVTDAADARAAAEARRLHDDGIVTSVLAVGTSKGAPIPSGGGFVSDRSGNVVIARLDREALRAVAAAGGGGYTELAGAPPDAALWAAPGEAGFARRDDALGERWKDAGPWLVLLLVPLALTGFRRGLFFVLPLISLGTLVAPAPVEAGWWDDLWQRRDQQAWHALREQDAARAAALAEDPGLAGEAAYRSEDYARAAQDWSDMPTADGHYNRGNALARLGQFDAAIAAYDRALELQPGMPDAVHNRAVVEQLKRQQEQEQQGDEGETGEDPSGEEQASESSQESESQQDGEDSAEDQGEQAGEPREGEAGDGEERQPQDFSETWSEEDAQAMEQWLRRIPDDPGGLLRRKFRNQHQRRGAPDDEVEGW
ncbi:MAG: VWA domain-containing protein [Xanthomonadales bacterium]